MVAVELSYGQITAQHIKCEETTQKRCYRRKLLSQAQLSVSKTVGHLTETKERTEKSFLGIPDLLLDGLENIGK